MHTQKIDYCSHQNTERATKMTEIVKTAGSVKFLDVHYPILLKAIMN